jgi:hypothetical protein
VHADPVYDVDKMKLWFLLNVRKNRAIFLTDFTFPHVYIFTDWSGISRQRKKLITPFDWLKKIIWSVG